jgi:predicted phage-related endonuclease
LKVAVLLRQTPPDAGSAPNVWNILENVSQRKKGNAMNDFSPEVRNTGLWATDARKIVAGRAAEVYLERIGEVAPPDLSDYEPAQWGLRLQESIARAAADKLRLNIKEADYSLTHKNYRFDKSKNFGEDGSTLVPEEDLAQCIHEAAVHGVQKVLLCVLFGGQELRIFPLDAEEAAKDVLIQTEAEIWGNIQTRTPPAANTPEAARKLFPRADGTTRTVGEDVAQVCRELRVLKDQIKQHEKVVEIYEAKLQNLLGSAEALMSTDGKVLCTWKQSKESKAFDRELFKSSMPDLYEQFVMTKPGNRRFLIK